MFLVQSETKLSLLNMTSVPSLTGFLKKFEMNKMQFIIQLTKITRHLDFICDRSPNWTLGFLEMGLGLRTRVYGLGLHDKILFT